MKERPPSSGAQKLIDRLLKEGAVESPYLIRGLCIARRVDRTDSEYQGSYQQMRDVLWAYLPGVALYAIEIASTLHLSELRSCVLGVPDSYWCAPLAQLAGDHAHMLTRNDGGSEEDAVDFALAMLEARRKP